MHGNLVFTLISKFSRFSGRHIGFLVGAKYRLKATSCCQFIFRKGRQGASINSKRFGNGSKKRGLGVVSNPPLDHTRVKQSLLSFHHFLQIRSFNSHIAPPKVLSVKNKFLQIRSFDSDIAPPKVLSVKKVFYR